jgi:ABC-type transport system involved in multi-copper enzyme maturation permease subunit
MLPVLNRELRVAARRRGTYWQRTHVGGFIGLAAATFLIFAHPGAGRSGELMFAVLSWSVFLLALLEGLRVTADSLAEERRNGTLGLLFLTPLRARDIVFAKLTAGGVRSTSALVATLPIFGLCLLAGGITPGHWARACFAAFLTLAVGLSVGIAVSAFVESSLAALAGGVILLFALFGWPFVVAVFGAELEKLIWLSGPLGMLLAAEWKTANDFENYWISLAYSGALTVLFYFLSQAVLRRSVTRAPKHGTTWWQVLLRPSGGRSEVWGGTSGRDDPAVWLAERTMPGRKALWALISIGGGLCLLAGIFGQTFSVIAVITAQLAAGFLLKLWTAALAPQSLGSARRSGALELILCTPISADRVVRGQVDALVGYMFSPALFTAVGFPLALTVGGMIGQNQSALEGAVPLLPFGMFWFMTFILDMHALIYVGLWLGLSEAKAETAVAKTAFRVLLLPLATLIIPIAGLAGLLIWPWFWINWAARKLRQELRAVAAGLNG